MLNYSGLNDLYYNSAYQRQLGSQGKAKSFWQWVQDPNREQYDPEDFSNAENYMREQSAAHNQAVNNAVAPQMPTQNQNNLQVIGSNLAAPNLATNSQPNNPSTMQETSRQPKKLSYSLLRNAYGGGA